MIDYTAVAARIREERRLNKRVSQEEMAADLGMYQADISNLERAQKGSGISDLNRLSRIAEYFGIPPEDLIFGRRSRKSLTRYEGKKSKLSFLSDPKDFTEDEARVLRKVFCRDPAKLALRAAQFGPYRVFYIPEELTCCRKDFQVPISKTHVCVFCEDKLIASMKASCVLVFTAMHQGMGRAVQEVMPWRVFDFSEVIRRLNPWVPLMRFEKDPGKKARHEKKLWERLEALREIKDAPIAVIESVYVREDFRQCGVCRMMLDGLAKLLGPRCSWWLNLEPADDEDLERAKTAFPLLTTASLGQMSLNAHIAECLGFRLENDLWRLPVSFEDADGKTHTEERRVRKVAYRLSAELAKILEEDGDLVDRGRLLQKVASIEGDEDSKDELDTLNRLNSENFSRDPAKRTPAKARKAA